MVCWRLQVSSGRVSLGRLTKVGLEGRPPAAAAHYKDQRAHDLCVRCHAPVEASESFDLLEAPA
jgi:hypothetical protein